MSLDIQLCINCTNERNGFDMKKTAINNAYREYFITVPLIEAKVPLTYGKCAIFLNGNKEKSYIEGPVIEAVDDAFDFICAIPVPNIKVVYRGTEKRITFQDESQINAKIDWWGNIFNQVPLKSLPIVTFGLKECKVIQEEIDTYEKTI